MAPTKDSILFYDIKRENKLRHLDKPRETLRCITCIQDFVPKRRYQLYCSEICQKEDERIRQEISDKLLTNQCKVCGLRFRKREESSRQGTCESCNRGKVKSLRIKVSEIDRWVKTKKRNGVSLQELIRRMEWKRVWDDEGWNHYLSGRKWDRI